MTGVQSNDTCLLAAFRQQVLKTPCSTAVRTGDGILTYFDLDRCSDVLAADLRAAGCKADTAVMLRMHRSAEMVIAIIAVLKAGGAYLPIATDLPEERVTFICGDARPVCLLERRDDGLAPSAIVGVTCPLRAVSVADLKARAQDNLQDIPDLSGDQLAYILYTSGSTGQPKGCLLEHKALRNRVWWMHRSYPIDGNDAVLQKTPYTFDVSVWEFVWPLAVGARLVLVPPEGHKDPSILRRLIEDQQITVCHFVPSMLRQFLRRLPSGACSSLKHVFLSGEALPFDLMSDALGKLRGSGLHNLYGPTEAAIDVSYFNCAVREDRKVPIGRAIDNIQLAVLDEAGKPVPTGTQGELYIAGVGLARGYLNRPDLTTERFPTLDLNGVSTRVYRTGDLAEVMPDGNILFHGRMDGQVKLRGQRIELGEIEAALVRLEDVEDAVVLVDDTEPDDPRLIAYCVSRKLQLKLADIRQLLEKILPSHCLPNKLHIVPEIPVSAHGKADHKALLSLQRPTAQGREDNEPSLTVIEPPKRDTNSSVGSDLLSLCREVLNAPDLQPGDDFFDLGATSFTLLKLGERIDAAFDVNIPVEVFLADPSVNGLSPHVGGAQSTPLFAEPGSLPAATPNVPTDALLSLCREVLNAPDLQPTDDFFDLGATSFTLLKLGERIDAAFDVNIPVEVFLADPSVNGLSPHVGAPVEAAKPRSAPIEPTVGSTASPAGGDLLSLCREVLNAPDLQPGDDFFDLGATSFTLLKLGERIDAAFDVNIPVEAFLADPSVSGLLPHVGGSDQTADFRKPAMVPSRSEGVVSLPNHRAMPLSAYSALDPSKPVTEVALLSALGPLSPIISGAKRVFRHASGGGKYPLRAVLHLGQPVGGIQAGCYLIHEGKLSKLPMTPVAEAGVPRLEFHADLTDLLDSYGVASGLLATLDLGYLAETLVRSSGEVELALSPSDTPAQASASLPDHWVPICAYDIGIPARIAPNQSIHDSSGLCFDAYVPHPPKRTGDPGTGGPEASKSEYRISTPTVDTHLRRQSRRTYLDTPLDLSVLSDILARLAPGARGCDVLVHVKERKVNGIAPGLYRYNAGDEALHLARCGSVPQLRQGFFPFNRKHFDTAAVTVIVLGDARDNDLPNVLHTLGRVGQSLLEAQPELGVGVCPIGWVAIEALRAEIPSLDGLDFLHGFTLGAWDFPELREAQTTAPSKPANAPSRSQVALVGMSGRFGNCVGEDAMWSLCEAGGSSIRSLPGNRRTHWGTKDDEAEIFGSAFDRIDLFDAEQFSIAPPEARSMDPQERLVLEEVYLALENAGHDPVQFARQAGRVGVFVGAMWQDYAIAASEAELEPDEPIGSATLSSIANHIAHRFGFDGPALAIDTGCSSALAAVDQARRAIAAGQCDAAIVAGVSLCAHPYHRRLLNRSDLLSRGPEVALFGAKTAGWVLGEGVGALVLRRAGDAVQNGDPIRAFIAASSTRHRGPARLRAMPDGAAQRRILADFLGESDLHPGDIHFVEAAAAGAAFADAVEIASMAEIARSGNANWPVGSSKANFGHAEAASGIAQVIKTVRQLESGRVAPVQVGDPISSKIPFDASYVFPASEPVLLPEGPRRGLINGYSAEGVCAHLVLQSADRPDGKADTDAPLFFPISARDQASLQQHLRDLSVALTDGMARGASLTEVARTLQTGRIAFEHRVVLLSADRADLVRQLSSLAAGGASQVPEHPVARAWVDRECDVWPAELTVAKGVKAPLPARPLLPKPFWMKATAARSDAPVPEDPRGMPADFIGWLTDSFAAAAELDPSMVAADTPLDELGLSSIVVARMIVALKEIGFADSPTSIWFNGQTLADVAAELTTGFGTNAMPQIPLADDNSTALTAAQPVGPDNQTPEPIAIVGLAARWPGADSLDAFWEILKSGRSVTGPAPQDRGDWSNFQTPGKGRLGRTYTTDIGALSAPYRFDARFFGITPREAETIDPQERVFLETAWSAVEDAGIAPMSLHKLGTVGVFAGVMNDNYERVVDEAMRKDDFCPPQTTRFWSIANRVSFHLDLGGPSLAVDTACSAGLSAVHLAMQSLRSGESQFALAGGVNLLLHPGALVARSMLGMLSPDGKCSVFGEDANGTVVAEGCGVVVLTPLSVAQQHGCHIHGVLRGSAMNAGGRTNGFTMPNSKAQARLVETALEDAGLSAADISCIEAHGTGTILGDPVEIDGLKAAFSASDQSPSSCAVGSVKLNIGHAESAAGMAALCKVLLQMRHETIVKGVADGPTNPQISTDVTVLRLQKRTSQWPRPDASATQKEAPCRRAGISSFGAGGANVHVIVEEPQAASHRQGNTVTNRLYPLSARSADALKAMARELAEMLGSGGNVDLGAVADTLCVGRDLFEHRAAIWADDGVQLQTALAAIADGATAGHSFAVGKCGPSEETDQVEQIRTAMADSDSESAARAWLKATKIDWDSVLPWQPTRMSLPTYPFEGQDIRPGQVGNTPQPKPITLRTDPEIFAHHEIQGKPTYAGIALVDLLFRALPDGTVLKDIAWHRFFRDDAAALLMQKAADGTLSLQSGDSALMSARTEADRQPGTLANQRSAIMGNAARDLSSSELYQAAEALGTRYGSGFRRLSHVMFGDGQGWAMVSPTDHHGALARAGMLDAGLQAAAALLVEAHADTAAVYPLTIGQFWAAREIPQTCQVFFRISDSRTQSCDILYCAPDGTVVAEMTDARFATSAGVPVAPERSNHFDPLVAAYAWQDQSQPGTDTKGPATVWCLDLSDTARGRLNDSFPNASFVRVSKARSDAAHRPDLDLNDDPDRQKDCLDDLMAQGLSPDLVVAWEPSPPKTVDAMGLEARLNGLFYPWLELAGLLARKAIAPGRVLHLVEAAGLEQEPIATALVSAFSAVAAENPAVTGQVGLVPSSINPTALAFLAEHTHRSGVYRYSNENWQRLGLRRLSKLAAEQPVQIRGLQVVTGGLGRAGRALVDHLLESTTAAQFLLVGRHAPDAAQQAWLDRNADRVAFVAADCAVRPEMRAALIEARAHWGEVRGVFHIAGLNRDRSLINVSPLDASLTLAPKLFGFVALDELMADDPLDHFTVFSSLAAEAPQAGQFCYGFANRAVAHLALSRDAAVRAGLRKGATRALLLPFLNGGGMQAHPAVLRTVAEETGVEPMQLSDIGPCVLQAQGRPEVVQAIMPGDQDKIAAYLERGAMTRTAGHVDGPPPQADPTAAQAMPEEEQAAALVAELTLSASDLLGIPADQIEPKTEFAELGMDSVLLTQWATSLSDRFGFEVLPTAFFDGFTMQLLAKKLLSDHGAALNAHLAPTKPLPVHDAGSVEITAPDPIQDGPAELARRKIDLVGLACRFPGAETAAGFWELLESGRIPTGIVPESRWPGSVDHAGLIHDIRRFDARFFAVSPMEAEQMDPQQRHLIEIAWQAFEDAGLPVESLKDVRTGVFVGASTHDYAEISVAAKSLGSHSSTGTGQAFLANRISYMFDLKGPSQTIDTACSSSLVALTRALDAMRSGRCDVALVAGVNLILTDTLHRIFEDAGMLSPRGRCSTFDADADGYVRSEGIGAIVLRARDVTSLQSGNCYCEVLGAAENHGGRAQSLTAPNPQAQADLVRDAYVDSGINVLDVDYVETHGTGTPLGDPVEVEGLKLALAAADVAIDHPIRLGAVKSQIGHLEAAAGIGSLIKATLCVRHHRFPANCNFNSLNPLLRLDGTPFRVQDRAADWATPKDRPRRVGVSSFGIGGSNAHVVLQEATAGAAAADETAPYLFVLSAKTNSALDRRQNDLAGFLSRGTVSLRDLSYTLAFGRAHFAHRRAFIADNQAALVAALQGKGPGQLEAGEPEEAMDWSHPERVGRAYLAGLSLPPQDNPQFDGARAISAPVYPFEGQDYWLPEAALTDVVGKAQPIVASDPILDQHRVNGAPVLPGMASVALAMHLHKSRCAQGVRNVRWVQPISVTEKGEITVSLDERGAGTVTAADNSPAVRFETADLAPKRHDLPGPIASFDSASDMVDAPVLYARLAEIGLQYGLAFRMVSSIRRHGDGYEAVLQRPDDWDSEPAWAGDAVLLDGALHVAAAARWDADPHDRRLAIPVGLSTLCLWDHLPDKVLVRLKAGADDHLNLDIYSLEGVHLAAIEGFQSQVVPQHTATDADASLLKKTWVRTPLPMELTSNCDRVIVLDNDPALAQQIADARPETTVRRIALNGAKTNAQATFDPADEDALERVLAQWDGDDWYPNLVVHNLAKDFGPSIVDDLEDGLLIGVKTAFVAVRALSRLGRRRASRFVYVYPEGEDDAVFAAASGLAHTVAAEQPSLRMTMISLADGDAGLLCDSLLHTPQGVELRLKDNAIWASQLDFSK